MYAIAPGTESDDAAEAVEKNKRCKFCRKRGMLYLTVVNRTYEGNGAMKVVYGDGNVDWQCVQQMQIGCRIWKLIRWR